MNSARFAEEAAGSRAVPRKRLNLELFIADFSPVAPTRLSEVGYASINQQRKSGSFMSLPIEFKCTPAATHSELEESPDRLSSILAAPLLCQAGSATH
jgi:hypothetical protein